MEQSSWEANRFSASQEIPRILWNQKVHYRMEWIFHNKMHFYGEEFSATRPIRKLEDQPASGLSATANSINSQLTLHTADRSSISNLRTRRAVVKGTHLSNVRTST